MRSTAPPDSPRRFATPPSGRKDELTGRPELDREEVARRDRLQELISELGWFLEDYRDSQSPTTWVVDQPDGEDLRSRSPLDPARYLQHTVWDRGNKFALLSATILSKEAFCRESVSTRERRPRRRRAHVPALAPATVRRDAGSMTYEHRDETVPKIARLIVRLMAEHPDEKG